jgi:protocatechuate 3,4-dioxygenase beta subunit
LLVLRARHLPTPERVALGEEQPQRPTNTSTPPLSTSQRGSIAGTVVHEDAGPAALARVCAVEIGLEAVGAGTAACVQANSAGVYLLPGMPAGGYALTAEAEDHAPASPLGGNPVFVTAGEDKNGVDFVIEGGGARLAGTVLDATGGAVPGATVRVTRTAPPFQSLAVTSDHDGRFSIFVAPGQVAIRAESTGYAATQVFRTAPASDVVLTLTPGATFSGDVVSALDGRPLSGIEVRAIPVGSWGTPVNPSATSGERGDFSIHSLSPGEYSLAAEGEGWRGTSDRQVLVGVAQTIEHLRLRVYPAFSVAGRVIERAKSAPCTQGSVTLGPTSPWPMSPYDPPGDTGESTTSAVPIIMAPIEPNGQVRFRSVSSGAYHVVVHCPDKVLTDGPRTLEIRDADRDGIVWTVDDGLGIVVHVVDEANRPVPNAPFQFLWPPRGPRASRLLMPVATDQGGSVEIPGVLYPGTYTAKPDVGYEAAPVDVDVGHGASTKTEVTLRLAGTRSILVTVRSAGGEPIDDVKVSAKMLALAGAADASTGGQQVRAAVALGNGRFRIGPASTGRYRIEAADGVNPVVSVDADASRGDGSVTLVLDRDASIRGRVVDSKNEPVADVWVTASCRSADAVSDRPARAFAAGRRVLTDPEGAFTLTQLTRTAACQLRAQTSSGAVALANDVHPGDTASIQLPELGILRGTVTESGGAAATRFTLNLREAKTQWSKVEAFVAADGRWSLADVVPGHLMISATTSDGAVAQASVDLAPGQALDTQLEVRPSAPERDDR